MIKSVTSAGSRPTGLGDDAREFVPDGSRPASLMFRSNFSCNQLKGSDDQAASPASRADDYAAVSVPRIIPSRRLCDNRHSATDNFSLHFSNSLKCGTKGLTACSVPLKKLDGRSHRYAHIPHR